MSARARKKNKKNKKKYKFHPALMSAPTGSRRTKSYKRSAGGSIHRPYSGGGPGLGKRS